MEDSLTSRLESVSFRFPAVAGKHVFVHGLGGGCDIITAFAVSHLLDSSAARIIYGNTKVGHVGQVEEVTPHIVRVASPQPEPGTRPRGRGKAAIDHAVPRNEHGCPWIVRLDDEIAERALVSEIQSLGFDLILGIDAGGDSIGRDSAERDQRMLRVLLQTGVPVLHVVVAPGCDGESSVADLRSAMENRIRSGRYRGCFALAPILPILREQSFDLSETRTPRIILAAADEQLSRTNDGLVIVPRGCKPVVPMSWLANAFVFEPAAIPTHSQ
jgi:hypothetical protein